MPRSNDQDNDPYDDLVEHLKRSLCELCRRGPWRGEIMFVPVKDAPPGDDWPALSKSISVRSVWSGSTRRQRMKNG